MTMSTPPEAAGEPAGFSLTGTRVFERPSGALIWPLAAVSLILGCAIVHYGRPVLMPLAVAGLLQFLLAPLVRRLHRAGLPAPLGAALLLVGLVGLVGTAFYHVSTPAVVWVEQLQAQFWRIEWRLSMLKEPLEGVARASKRVEEMTQVDSPDPAVLVVKEKAGDPVRLLLKNALQFGTSFLFVLFLLFFLLARDGTFMHKLPVLVREPELRARITEILGTLEREISAYLLTITAINVALGLVVGGAMYLLDVPNPLLWGLMACFLNFVPYLGALVGASIILIVSLLSPQVENPLLPALAYVLLNGLEGMLITPLILGRMLSLSPVAVFLWLILSGWLWGIPGALLAVPLLAVVKLICDKVPGLFPIARLLDS